MNKPRWLKALKIAGAAVCAFAALNLLSAYYYNLPAHKQSETGATDYVWEAEKPFFQLTEGHGYGRSNNEGYTDANDYTGQPIDVLIVGSSQMEGSNVAPDETTAAQLTSLLAHAGAGGEGMSVYNIGMSSHTFPRCASNLWFALDTYHPRDCVVIETQTVAFKESEVADIINGTVPELALEGIFENVAVDEADTGVLGLLQDLPYARLIYRQVKFATGSPDGGAQDAQAAGDEAPAMSPTYSKTLTKALSIVAELGVRYDTEVVIFYHPHLTPMPDGSAEPQTDEAYLDVFRAACEANGIRFIDMTDVFLDAYETKRVLPHGFGNTVSGAGHLNADGHLLIARTLAEEITAR